ncbi:MAG: outer membrane beta-barrel protein [Bacteroidetes bacterium]|nr:outer membrane beta-barrel protein [Bacteroidota bacterium]
MKRNFVWSILLMALFASNIANAQSKSVGFFANPDRFFYGGITAGANFSTVDGDGYGGYHKVGLNAGGIVYIKVLKRLFVSMEILYTEKGSVGVMEYNNYYTGTGFDKYYLKLNYAEVPVIFNFQLDKRWQIGVGASYGQLVKVKEEAVTQQYYNFDPATHPFHKQDYNFVIKGSMQIGDGLFVNAKYQYSLSTIRDANNIPLGYGGGAQYNNFFNLGLMYLIGSGQAR